MIDSLGTVHWHIHKLTLTIYQELQEYSVSSLWTFALAFEEQSKITKKPLNIVNWKISIIPEQKACFGSIAKHCR